MVENNNWRNEKITLLLGLKSISIMAYRRSFRGRSRRSRGRKAFHRRGRSRRVRRIKVARGGYRL